ncbi:uncharacterized protein LOC105844140 [Hydra vulgaris]|uniref:uncharacterized protein LOC105844140 n=1 Tax=Hydra vulgaris TaxID=6087 RepID=UPI001F5F6CB4|nr:uncharacterized protein LOC105844140 [Hydra vulgaris]
MNFQGPYFVQVILFPMLYILHVTCRRVPIISFMKTKRDLMNRESVKKLQLQTMLNALNIKSSENDELFNDRLSETVKRDTDGNPIVNTDFSNLIGSQNEDWDLVRQPDLLSKQDDIKNNNEFLEKRANTPCRRKREILLNKRSLDTPHGEGLVPAYGIYDEMCEDSLPVEVVKIDKLVVEDGVIKDQNIIEKAMLA